MTTEVFYFEKDYLYKEGRGGEDRGRVEGEKKGEGRKRMEGKERGVGKKRKGLGWGGKDIFLMSFVNLIMTLDVDFKKRRI